MAWTQLSTCSCSSGREPAALLLLSLTIPGLAASRASRHAARSQACPAVHSYPACSFWISSLAAPSVKNAANARRMSATAAAAAAVRTTPVNPSATEAELVGSLQGLLAQAPPADSCDISGMLANDSSSGSSSGGGSANGSCDEVAPAERAKTAARSGAAMPVACASCLLVESEMSVQRALDLMLAGDQHVAVVLGDDGGVMGLVTRDVLLECVEAGTEASSELLLAQATVSGKAGSADAAAVRAKTGGD